MRLKIVHYQFYLFCFWIPVISDSFYKHSPILFGFKFRNFYKSLTLQWLICHKYIDYTMPYIFIIHPCVLTATNPPLFSGGITQPFTFQGLSSFFLEHFLQLRERCFLQILILPSCLPVIVGTIWNNPWAVHCSRGLLIWLPYRHLISFHKYG